MPIPTKQQIIDALKNVKDPEIMIGIVDLGLIYKVDVDDDGTVDIDMTLTAMGCPYGDMLIAEVKEAAEKVEGVTEANVYLIWNPPWDPEIHASDEAKDKLGIW